MTFFNLQLLQHKRNIIYYTDRPNVCLNPSTNVLFKKEKFESFLKKNEKCNIGHKRSISSTHLVIKINTKNYFEVEIF